MRDGGAAFPFVYEGCDGMSLRDYLAGQALPEVIKIAWGASTEIKELLKKSAELSYKIADAMLEAREK